MIAVVTGATGFIGSHLVKALIQDNWTVHAIVRPTSEARKLALLPNKTVRHVYDGNHDTLESILRKAHPDIVFHLATLFVGEHRSEQIAAMVSSNILFGAQLLEAMSNSGITSLINAGTAWQHYGQANYSPASLYAATKQAFEAILQFYIEARRIHAATLTLSDTYGPDDQRQKLLFHLKSAAITGKPLHMSPGEQVLDLTFVDDVTRAFLIAAQRLMSHTERPTHEEFSVSSGETHTLRQVVSIYERALGRPIPVIWGGKPYRAREMMEPWQGGLPLPGWAPNVRLADGLMQIERNVPQP